MFELPSPNYQDLGSVSFKHTIKIKISPYVPSLYLLFVVYIHPSRFSIKWRLQSAWNLSALGVSGGISNQLEPLHPRLPQGSQSLVVQHHRLFPSCLSSLAPGGLSQPRNQDKTDISALFGFLSSDHRSSFPPTTDNAAPISAVSSYKRLEWFVSNSGQVSLSPWCSYQHFSPALPEAFPFLGGPSASLPSPIPRWPVILAMLVSWLKLPFLVGGSSFVLSHSLSSHGQV